MRCFVCHFPVRPGLEEAKRFEFWVQPDGSVKVFGRGAPDGKLEDASGRLSKVMHPKCFHTAERRAERGMAEVGAAVLAARAADPSYRPAETDWRGQEVVGVEELLPDAGDRSNRGAAEAGDRVREPSPGGSGPAPA